VGRRVRLQLSLASKYRTYEQVAAAQEKAVRFADDVLDDQDLGDDLDDLSVEEYASRKGLIITNLQRRIAAMANGNGMTKDDMQDCIDQATDILTDAYTPEASREDLASAIGDALDALSGDYDDGSDGDDDSDDDDYQSGS
jgi:hypothetical protein